MKKEIRILGIDDGPFDKFKKGKVIVIGAVFRGGSWLDGILSTKITADGKDSTQKLIEMINKSKFKQQLRAILLDGIALGGFNIIDVEKLSHKTKVPVITVIRKMPDFEKIKKTLIKLNKKSRIKLIEKAGEVHNFNGIYFQVIGIEPGMAKQILKIACTRSLIPEAIRAAHMIASGVVKGESRGRA